MSKLLAGCLALLLVAGGRGSIFADDKDVIDALLQTLKTDSDQDVKKSAAQALGKIGRLQPGAVTALTEVLDYQNDKIVRELAADQLWRLSSGEETRPPIDKLVKALGDPESAGVRMRAAQILGVIGPDAKNAVGKLTEVFKNKTEDPSVRMSAVIAVGKIGPDTAPVIAALADVAKDKMGDLSLRRSAVEVLGRIGQDAKPAVTAMIVVMMDQGEDGSLREWIRTRLLEIGPAKDSIPPLIALIGDKKQEKPRRYTALKLLAMLGADAKDAIKVLIDVMNDADDDLAIRLEAIGTLAAIGPQTPDVIPALVKILENAKQDNQVRAAVASGLARMGASSPGTPQVVTALVKVVQNNQEDRGLRAASVSALARLGVQGTDAIGRIFKMSSAEVQQLTKDTLKEQRPVDALVAVLKDTKQDNKLRVEFIGLLPRTHDPTVVKSLRELLAPPDPVKEVRLAAAAALGEIFGSTP